MIHYHGTPVTPESAMVDILKGRHAMVSFANPMQLDTCLDICQSVTADNGAFPLWMRGQKVDSWEPYYEWLTPVIHHPAFDWALIPDVIDGDEEENRRLVESWPMDRHVGVPVWHLHESMDYLFSLLQWWPRIAIGSSGEHATIGTAKWWTRMGEAMEILCPDGFPVAKIHGLRMLNPEIFTRFPFASADSTNVARNIGIDGAWRGTYLPPNKAVRGIVIAERIESQQSAPRWERMDIQRSLYQDVPPLAS